MSSALHVRQCFSWQSIRHTKILLSICVRTEVLTTELLYNAIRVVSRLQNVKHSVSTHSHNNNSSANNKRRRAASAWTVFQGKNIRKQLKIQCKNLSTLRIYECIELWIMDLWVFDPESLLEQIHFNDSFWVYFVIVTIWWIVKLYFE